MKLIDAFFFVGTKAKHMIINRRCIPLTRHNFHFRGARRSVGFGKPKNSTITKYLPNVGKLTRLN